MNPAWQAQVFDQNKIAETIRWMASIDFDLAEVIRHNQETIERLVEANLDAVEMYRQAAQDLFCMMINETGASLR